MILEIGSVSMLFFCWMYGSFFLHKKGIIHYVDKPLFSLLYFLIPIVLIVMKFDYLFEPLISFEGQAVTLLGLFLVFIVLLPFVLRKGFVLRRYDFLHKSINEFRLNHRYIISKSADILFQQVCIFVLVALTYQIVGNTWITISIFAVAFALMHTHLINTLGFRFGIIFIVGAFFGGALFSLLIIEKSDSLVYTYVIHWLFYVFLFLIFRYKRTRKLLLLPFWKRFHP